MPFSRAGAPLDASDSTVAASAGGVARIGQRLLPDPTDPANLAACRIGRPAAVCDPDGVLGSSGAARAAAAIEMIRARVRMPCGSGGGSGGAEGAPALVAPEIAIAIVASSARPSAEGGAPTYSVPFDESDALLAAAAVLDGWRVGARSCSNGIALVLSVHDRRVALRTGPGARGALGDAESADIVAGMRPALRDKAYTDAILIAIGRIGDALARAPGTAPPRSLPRAWRAAAAAFLAAGGARDGSHADGFGGFGGGGGGPLSGWRAPAGAAAAAAGLWAWGEASRSSRFHAAAQRIERALVTHNPRAAFDDRAVGRSAARGSPSASAPPVGCDVCLRAPPEISPSELLSDGASDSASGGSSAGQALRCGHHVCHACRWRFAPPPPPQAAEAGWRLAVGGRVCPVCALAASRHSERAAGLLPPAPDEEEYRRAYLARADEGEAAAPRRDAPRLRWGGSARSTKGVAPGGGQRLLMPIAPKPPQSRDALLPPPRLAAPPLQQLRREPRRLPGEDEALWLLRMRSLGASVCAPRWARDGGELSAASSRRAPWLSHRSRALLAAEPAVLRPPPLPPLGPADGGAWSPAQTRIGQSAIAVWQDVRRHARIARRSARGAWSADDDGWARVPDAPAFGGGSSTGDGGGGRRSDGSDGDGGGAAGSW